MKTIKIMLNPRNLLQLPSIPTSVKYYQYLLIRLLHFITLFTTLDWLYLYLFYSILVTVTVIAIRVSMVIAINLSYVAVMEIFSVYLQLYAEMHKTNSDGRQ